MAERLKAVRSSRPHKKRWSFASSSLIYPRQAAVRSKVASPGRY
jgi:hypothetical protein